ncbi:two-component sensor histidine kinase [Streptomyces sp. CBMA29]|nr:two-component sensor histidine kinase [Streptomyces sp. CBMA29]
MLQGSSLLREYDRRHPWLLDTTVVLLFAGVCLPNLLSGGTSAAVAAADADGAPSTATLYVLFAALVLPLWWRRRAPATVLLVTIAAFLVQSATDAGLVASFSPLIALHNVARHSSPRVLAWATAVAAAANVVDVFALETTGNQFLVLFFLLGLVTAAAATGLTLRTRRMYLTALEDRARRLEVERDQRARLTAAAERTRIAREMHDIVGHNLSVMVTLADGASTLAARNNESSTPVLRMVGDTGRQALGELRRVLGVLRGDDDAADRRLRPQPGIGDLDMLLARVRAAGLAVTYRTTGELATLGEGLQLTVYRIVQEALTNTLKHAGTATASQVTVTADAGTVRIRVTDTGPPPNAAGPPAPPTGDDEHGHGLVGIRQRVALYGGTVTIGPGADQPGWTVDVQLDATVDPTDQKAESHLP